MPDFLSDGSPADPAVVGSLGGSKKPAGLVARSIVGYDVRGKDRILLCRCRSPLDIEDVWVAISFAQLKHVAGQLVMQEGEREGTGTLHLITAEGVVKV